MILGLVLISIFFVAIGLVVKESNAFRLLAGFNTMKPEERQKIDLDAYIRFFRRFHFILGGSFLVFGLLFLGILPRNISGIFMALYPVAAYIYFISAASKFMNGVNRVYTITGIIILCVTLLLMIVLGWTALRESEMIINENQIQIGGSFGERIPSEKLRSVSLVNELPEIHTRVNGFSLGDVRKGWFKTIEGEKLKLILNSAELPLILIVRKDGQKIYYSAKEAGNEELYRQIESLIP